MKKKVLTILIICMCLSASGVFAYSKLRPVQGENEFGGIGENMQSSVKSLLSADISLESSPIATYESRNVQDAMGEVLGTKISKTYFDVRYASYKSSPLEYENPKEEAWESIKKEVWEREFAEKNSLMPTDEEIRAYVETNKEGFHSTEEGKALIKALCEGMGLTEDEYWKYHEKYEAPLAVIHNKVEQFAKNKKIEIAASDEISSTILDNDYFNQLS